MTEAQESMPATANSAAVKTVLIWGGVFARCDRPFHGKR